MPLYNQEELFSIGLDSIPADPRVETIVIDDGSTDHSRENVEKYIQEHPEKNIKLLGWADNRGVSAALNEGLDNATGKYVVFLASDGDYFLDGKITKALDMWLTKDYDMVFFNIIRNNGSVSRLNRTTTRKYVGSTKFIKRSFIGNTRFSLNYRRAEDVIFTYALLEKEHTEMFTNEVIKHYNYPRKGSLTWNARHGITDPRGFPINGN